MIDAWILDLETIPEGLPAGEPIRVPESYLEGFEPPEVRNPPKNYRTGSEAWRRWHAEEAEKHAERVREAMNAHSSKAREAYLRTALHPRKCQIVSWALAPLEGGEVHADSGEDERSLLESLIEAWPRDSVILAWNGPSFDYRVLWARCLRLELPAPVGPTLRAGRVYWSHSRQLDLMAFAPEARSGRVSLRAAAEAWRVPVETPPGSKVAELWSAGDLRTIEDHCVEDVKVSRALAHHFGVSALLEEA
jgi:DNA polymerase elongation subunit (family B)